MRSYWQGTRVGWTISAAMFAAAIGGWPLAPVTIPAHRNGAGSMDRYGDKFQGLLLVALSAVLAWGWITTRALFEQGKSDPAVSRVLILPGYAILLIFLGVFSDMNYLLLPGLLPVCGGLGNLQLCAFQKRPGSALPG